MAEENSEELEGFDDLDGLLDEDAGGGGDEDFAGELDDFLGADEDAGGDDGFGAGDDDFGGGDEFDAGGEDGEGGDSELDSFFEDLSTIDDLEVTQDDASAEAAPEEMPGDDGEPMGEMPAAAPVAAVADVAIPGATRAPKGKRRSWLRRMILLILLGLVGGSGYYAYITFFPDQKVPWPEIPLPEFSLSDIPIPQLPWPLVEEILEEEPLVQQQVRPPPPEPSPLSKLLPPSMRPAPEAPPPSRPVAPIGPPPPRGKGYGVQVATCFFPKCVKGFQNLLARNNRRQSTTVLGRRNESLEILSSTVFDSRETAEGMAVRINREHRLEGQAYVIQSGGGFKISMGTFPDLSRASLVRDSLNQRMEGQVFFTSRLKTRSYKMSKIITGRYASRDAARQEQQALRSLDARFKDAFIVRN